MLLFCYVYDLCLLRTRNKMFFKTLMTSLLSPVYQTSKVTLQSCCLPVTSVILHGILCCVSHKGHIISLNSCKETGVPAHQPLAAGEPEGASDPLFCEQAGERVPMLLRWLLEQVLQKKQETNKQKKQWMLLVFIFLLKRCS